MLETYANSLPFLQIPLEVNATVTTFRSCISPRRHPLLHRFPPIQDATSNRYQFQSRPFASHLYLKTVQSHDLHATLVPRLISFKVTTRSLFPPL